MADGKTLTFNPTPEKWQYENGRAFATVFSNEEWKHGIRVAYLLQQMPRNRGKRPSSPLACDTGLKIKGERRRVMDVLACRPLLVLFDSGTVGDTLPDLTGWHVKFADDETTYAEYWF